MSSRKTVMSMSSEKREINPCPLESDVPPLKRSLGPPAARPLKRASSVQQTQKSFSMFCWTVPSRLPAPMNKSRRSFAEAASTVANPGIIAILWGERSDHRGLILMFIMMIVVLAVMVILLMILLLSILAHGILSGLGCFGFALRLPRAIGPAKEITHDCLHPLRKRGKALAQVIADG